MQDPVEFPPPFVYPDQVLPLPLPPMFPFNLPNRPHPPGALTPAIPPSSPNTPGSVTPVSRVMAIEGRIRNENKKEIRQIAADIEATIERELTSSTYTTLNSADLKKAVAERIAAEAAAKAVAERTAAEATAKAVAERFAAEAAAKAVAERIAAEATAKAVAERIVAEATAKAVAERIAAEAAAKAVAERIAAEAEFIRVANTYSASGSKSLISSIVITAAGTVASTAASFSLRAAIGASVDALTGLAASVGAGFVAGVSALFYSSSLGNGELPRRFSLQTPLSDLAPSADSKLTTSSTTNTSINLPYRFSSQVNSEGNSEIFVVKTDGETVPMQVPVLAASYDNQRNVYTATTADIPPRILTWTPIVTKADASTSLPIEQPEPPIFAGAALEPVEVRVDSYPGVADASWDDYVIVFPADSGLSPIYTMFRDRRGDPGTATGVGIEVDGSWAAGVSLGKGASIPNQVADLLRGQEFRDWRHFRETLWRAIGNDATLSIQFSPFNIERMKKGRSPFVPQAERIGGRAVLEIHHKVFISKGGEVFDLDNLSITTPKLHIQIHKGMKR
ncbi:S-type pyocin domain-containing protein [Pseudomonas sp.]|uniref:S-type pyocin domain-containing protein n=1 Tax=Pseudomonas sp. TaxID=306 RepID=UPI001B131FDF|nr:S-type pyocin domain-containing protein [Pseudomonas sp.]MBO9550020.1 S-type pyocin domain-containing protein [Pseudomonas sp.]